MFDTELMGAIGVGGDLWMFNLPETIVCSAAKFEGGVAVYCFEDFGILCPLAFEELPAYRSIDDPCMKSIAPMARPKAKSATMTKRSKLPTSQVESGVVRIPIDFCSRHYTPKNQKPVHSRFECIYAGLGWASSRSSLLQDI